MKEAKKSSNPPAPMKAPAQPPTEQPREVPPDAPVSPGHEEVSARARTLWENRGRPEGRDLEHWLEAERELRGGRQGSPSGAPQQPRREPNVARSELTDEDIESDKRVDGLVQRPRKK